MSYHNVPDHSMQTTPQHKSTPLHTISHNTISHSPNITSCMYVLSSVELVIMVGNMKYLTETKQNTVALPRQKYISLAHKHSYFPVVNQPLDQCQHDTLCRTHSTRPHKTAPHYTRHHTNIKIFFTNYLV